MIVLCAGLNELGNPWRILHPTPWDLIVITLPSPHSLLEFSWRLFFLCLAYYIHLQLNAWCIRNAWLNNIAYNCSIYIERLNNTFLTFRWVCQPATINLFQSLSVVHAMSKVCKLLFFKQICIHFTDIQCKACTITQERRALLIPGNKSRKKLSICCELR